MPSTRFVIRGAPPPPEVVVVFVSEDGRESVSIQASASDPLSHFFRGIKERFPDADRLTLDGLVLDLTLPFIDLGISLSERIVFSRNQNTLPSPSLGPEQFAAALASLEAMPDSPLIEQAAPSGPRVKVTFRYRFHERRYLYREFPAGSTIADAKQYLRQQSDLAPFYLYLQSGRGMAPDAALLTESEIVIYVALLLLVDTRQEGIWVFPGREPRSIASVIQEYAVKFAVDPAALSIGYSSSPEIIPPETLLNTLEYRPDDLLVLRGPILREYILSYGNVSFPVSCRAEATILEAARLAGVIDKVGTEEVVFRIGTTMISPPGAGIGTYEPRRVIAVLRCTDEDFLFRDLLKRVYSLAVRTDALVRDVAQLIRATGAFARATAIRIRFRQRDIASDRPLRTIGTFGNADDFDVIASRHYNIVGGPDGLFLDLLDDQTVGQVTALLRQMGHDLEIVSGNAVADPDALILAVEVDGVISVRKPATYATFSVKMPGGTTVTQSVDVLTTVADFLTVSHMTGFTLFAGRNALSPTDKFDAVPQGAELSFRRQYRFASDLWEEACVVVLPCHRRISDAIRALTDDSSEEYLAFLATNPLDRTARLSSIPYSDSDTIYLHREREIVFRLDGTDRILRLRCQDNATVQQVKTALAPMLPDIRCRFELATATKRLNDADILLVTASAGEELIIRPTEVRRYRLVVDKTGEQLTIDMDSFFKVQDLLTALKKHRTEIYIKDPNEPLGRYDRLSDVVPEGALLHLGERRVAVNVALESGTRVVRLRKHATFKVLKRALAGQLGVSDQELSVFVDGKELSDKDEDEQVKDRNVEVRVTEIKYLIKMPGVAEPVSVCLARAETVGDFKAKLRVGTTAPVEIGGVGLPIESRRLLVRCEGQRLPDTVKFSEVGRTAGFDVLLDFLPIPHGAEVVVQFSSLANPQPLGGDLYVYDQPETGDRWVVSFTQSPVQAGQNPYPDLPRELVPLARIGHPCLLAVCQLQQVPGQLGPQYATGFTPGGSLEAVLARPQRTWNSTAKTITILGTLFALRHVYSRGLVHGGVRPDNIFFDAQMKPKVGGFGSGQGWAYLAPEVLMNAGAGEQADVFAFALVVFEILTGKKVFGQVKSPAELSNLHYGGDRPKFPEILDSSIRELFQNSLRADAQQRPLFADFVTRLNEIGMLPIMDDSVDGQLVTAFATEVRVWEQKHSP